MLQILITINIVTAQVDIISHTPQFTMAIKLQYTINIQYLKELQEK